MKADMVEVFTRGVEAERKDGAESIYGRVFVDMRELLSLLLRASRNRNGRAKCGPLHVVARCVSISGAGGGSEAL